MVGAAGAMCDATQVKFEFEQRWTASVDEVVDVYLDESFWTGMVNLRKTSPPTVLDIARRADSAVVRLHWVLSVDLPREAARFIDPDDVAWVEETNWDLSSGVARVSFHPDQAAGLLRASATARLEEVGSEAVRSIDGDLSVRIPLLGRKVEPAIVEGVVEHLGEEAEAIAARLSG